MGGQQSRCLRVSMCVPLVYALPEVQATHISMPIRRSYSCSFSSCSRYPQLTSYKTVGPQNSKYICVHSHLNGGLDSSTSTQFVMQVGAQEWRPPMVTLFILIHTMHLPFRKCLLYTCNYMWFLDLFANLQKMRSKESFWTFLKVSIRWLLDDSISQSACVLYNICRLVFKKKALIYVFIFSVLFNWNNALPWTAYMQNILQ